MREGYGKSKLFMLVLFSIVGILLMPYGMLGSVKHTDKNNMEAEKQSQQAERTLAENRVRESGQETAANDRLDCIVGITVKDAGRNVIYASGNGVVLSCGENGLCIVTAGHVLDGVGTDGAESRMPDAQVELSFWNTENWTGTPDTEAECNTCQLISDADLAFLFLDQEQGKGLNITPVPQADKMSYDSLRPGDIVRTIGWDEGQKVIYEGTLRENWIFVEDFSQYMMAAECVMNPGMSGCGLYNERDELIGIACGGNESGILVAVPLSVVQARLREMR